MNLATPNKLVNLKPELIASALNRSTSVTEAARALGVPRQALYDYMPDKIGKYCVYYVIEENRGFKATVHIEPIVDTEGQAQ